MEWIQRFSDDHILWDSDSSNTPMDLRIICVDTHLDELKQLLIGRRWISGKILAMDQRFHSDWTPTVQWNCFQILLVGQHFDCCYHCTISFDPFFRVGAAAGIGNAHHDQGTLVFTCQVNAARNRRPSCISVSDVSYYQSDPWPGIISGQNS